MHLSYRNFRMRDLNGFASIVGHTFKDDTYTTNRFVSNCVMRHELLCYLRSQNYAKVVYGADNPSQPEEPIGIFIAKIGKAFPSVFAVCLSALYTVPLLFFRPGRHYLAYMRGLRNTDMRLLAGKHLSTELKLFLVRREYQNEGIGRRLLLDFEEVLKQHQVKRFFLFTDSYCNVDYYLERGFVLEGMKTYNFFHESPPPKYFLFTYRL